MRDRNLSDGELYADDLTWREQEILMLLAERLTNREIANRLHLAESTIKDYVGKILNKLYVVNRREAVMRAKALGLLDVDRKVKTSPPINLPPESTSFIGRVVELGEIWNQLRETRLLTLTGPGGIGKTRLALKAAEKVSKDYKDGIFFVALAPIRSVEHIIQTIAEALRFPLATHENPQYQLLRYLKNRQLLLVMDNFEHLLEGVWIVSEILGAAPGVKILATSREKLNLRSETNLVVSGMDGAIPINSGATAKNDATYLFVQRASKVCAGFDPSPAELVQIRKICQIVQGMPLAIELAAAWLHILNVDEIAEELEKSLDILSSEVHDAPERHRSIRAVFDHSWSLLHQAERETFMRLSVFRRGFTRQAAQQVSGASLQLLSGLVNKSLLSHDPNSGRLEIHEILRQYAQERLEAIPQANFSVQEAHAAYYATFMEQSWQDLKGRRQLQALAEVEADIENVRTAWRYYLDQNNVSQMWKFTNGLWYVYWIHWWNHAGMELFAEAVRILEGYQDEETIALRATAMAFQAYFMAWLGLAEEGFELAREGVQVLKGLNHPNALAIAYDSLVVNGYFLHRYSELNEATDKMFQIASEINDKWLLAFTLFAASMSALVNENFQEAKRLAEFNLNLNEEIGDVIGTTLPLIVLGHVALASGEHEAASGFYLRCLKISEKTGFHYGIQTASKYLGKVTLSLGKATEAEKYLRQCLRITREIGFVRDIINLLFEYACLRASQNKAEQATELLGFVLQHPASSHFRWFEGRICDSASELLGKLEGELPHEIFTTALARGQGLDLDGIVAGLVGNNR